MSHTHTRARRIIRVINCLARYNNNNNNNKKRIDELIQKKALVLI